MNTPPIKPIDANELERMAKERPDECFLKGTGILKLTDAIRHLEAQLRQAILSQSAAALNLQEFRQSLQGLKYMDTDPVEHKDTHNKAIDEALWLLDNFTQRTALPQHPAAKVPEGLPTEPPDELINAMALAYEQSPCHDLTGPMIDAYYALVAYFAATPAQAEMVKTGEADQRDYAAEMREELAARENAAIAKYFGKTDEGAKQAPANGMNPCGQVVAIDPLDADGPGVNWLGAPPNVGTLLYATPHGIFLSKDDDRTTKEKANGT